MKLSKSLLAIPVASFLIAVGVASGACSASVSVTIPTGAVVPYSGSEAIPGGYVFGTTTCDGDIYFVLGDGWGFCDDGIWDYTDMDPTGFGDYTLDTSVSSDTTGDSNGTGASTGAGTGASTGADTGASTGASTGAASTGAASTGAASTGAASSGGGASSGGASS